MPSPAVSADVWEDTLQVLFRDISGLETFWRDQERPFIPEAICLLKVLSDVGVGIDETRTVLDPSKATSSPPSEIQPTQCGLRTVVLQVQVETYDQDASRRARFFLSTIRSRIRRPSSLLVLKEIETSLIQIFPIIVVPAVVDGRAYSLATMDVRLHTIDIEDDQPFGRIDKLAIAPSFIDEGGSPISTPPFTIDLPDP